MIGENKGQMMRRCRRCSRLFVHHFFGICENCLEKSKEEEQISRGRIYAPTEEVIAEECKKIREGKVEELCEEWSEEEMYRRAGLIQEEVEASTVTSRRGRRRGRMVSSDAE